MQLRQALPAEADTIWGILQEAIAQRKRDGSQQWQNGYPNLQTVRDDIARDEGYVLACEGNIVAYAAVIARPEPAYAALEGAWLTNGAYLVVHRVARARSHVGTGIAAALLQQLEAHCQARGIPSIRLDTNFDNVAMLKTLERLGYHYCGEVQYHGSPRRAFEKVIAAL